MGSFLFIYSNLLVLRLLHSRIRVGVFLSPIKLSQIGSFHLLLVLATECFFSFDIFEIPSDAFSGCYCVLAMLTVPGSTIFLILVLMFLKYVFFCVHLLCGFLWYKFFHFGGQCVAS